MVPRVTRDHVSQDYTTADMAGHSKWAGIKHKKAIVDAQRGKAFSKVIRELTAAARPIPPNRLHFLRGVIQNAILSSRLINATELR